MEYISHIHLFKAVLLPLLQHQSVFQEMGVSTGCKAFQPADAVLKLGAVKGPCHSLSQRMVPVSSKRCFCKFSCKI